MSGSRAQIVVLGLAAAMAVAFAASQPARSAYPGRNGLIAFNRQVGQEIDIAVVAPDRTGLRVLIRDAYDPAWSPDGRLLAFTRRSSTGDTDIWIANADGSGEHDLFSPDTNERAASWSPDGQRLVIQAWAHGQQSDELYTEDADGGNRVQLTHANATTAQESPMSPQWSPTGQLIVFAETDNLYTIQPDGQGVRGLSDEGTAINPDWSPDGTRVVYDASGRSGRFGAWDDIYVLPVDGTSRARDLTNTLDYDGNAAWSPDGTRIVYTIWKTRHGESTGHGDLYVTTANGGRRQPLVRGAASKWGADWQPTPG
jgi:Tol biopolymer transport system component